jgi:ribulose-phosphate 3-epimerase
MVKVSPSLLSADFANLGRDVVDITGMGADYLHIDVMDGSFVPNITIGPGVIKSIRGLTKVPFIAHLMIDRPEKMVANFAEAGADLITVHIEAKGDVLEAMKIIRRSGKKVGIAVNPPTPLERIKDLIPIVDIILIMTVNPGWAGQKFIPEAAEKIAEAKKIITEEKLATLIEVDGGINQETGKVCVGHGVDVLAAGSSIFGAKDRRKALEALKGL